MIFAAGLGTRLRPLTDTMPKALVRIAGQPLIWHVLQRLRAAGFQRVVVNVHHFADQITDYLENNFSDKLDIAISDESSKLLETGGGIKKARPLLSPEHPVLIHNVDILSNADLTSLYNAVADNTSSQAGQTPDAALLVSVRKTKRYLLFDEANNLRAWNNIETGEVRSPQMPVPDIQHLTRLAFSGIHVLSPQALDMLDDMPERFSIIDFYLKHCHNMAVRACQQDGLQLLDVGKLDSLDKAEHFINNKNTYI